MAGNINTKVISCYLEDNTVQMRDLLKRFVQVESPSTLASTQQLMLSVIQKEFEEVGMYTMILPGKKSGGQLYARPLDRDRGRPLQLLVGHADTVWPVGSIDKMPIREEDGRFYGPGSYDMKAGLVEIIFSLKAIADTGHAMPLTPVILINTDEEIGSFESTNIIKRLARISERAFILEPPLGPEGKLKTARKGIGRFTLSIQGISAHAGLDPDKGASAIIELSNQIQRLFAMNDPEQGVTVNVGMIEGGERANVVAAVSKAVVDVRVPGKAEAVQLEKAIKGLKPSLKGVSLQVEGGFGRPPMEPTPRNRALWFKALKLGEEIGLQLEEAFAGGGSDGNTTSQYTATLDGLGAVGDGAHALHEHVWIHKMTERCTLLSLLLLQESLSESRIQGS